MVSIWAGDLENTDDVTEYFGQPFERDFGFLLDQDDLPEMASCPKRGSGVSRRNPPLQRVGVRELIEAFSWSHDWADDVEPGGDDFGKALAIDMSGNVLVTGSSATITHAGAVFDYATIKYSNAGVPLWTNRYDGLGGDDLAAAMAVDVSGSVFVSGYSDLFFRTYAFRYSTVEYSAEGVALSTNVSDVGGIATAMTFEGSGALLVTGYSLPPDEDYMTIKYSVLKPTLLLQRVNNQVILSWTNAALQSAPALTDAFTNVPNAASPYTNTSVGMQQFFRLISN